VIIINSLFLSLLKNENNISKNENNIMKKIILSVAILVLALGANAQKRGSSESKPNVVKVNPLGLLFGQASISYERALDEKNAVQVTPTFGFLSVGGVKYSTLGLSAEYRYYLSNSKTAPQGFYVSPGVGFASVKVKETGGASFTGSAFSVKALIGNQWTWESGFALDLFGGVNYVGGGKVKGTGGVEYTKFSGVLPALGVSLGYNF
jgi:hypothetical protein